MRKSHLTIQGRGKVYTLSMLLILAELSGCAFAPWEASKRNQGTPESRVSEAEQKYQAKPEVTKLRKDVHVSKESAVDELLTEAEKSKANGQVDNASMHYDRVLNIAPDNQTALAGKSALARDVTQ